MVHIGKTSSYEHWVSLFSSVIYLARLATPQREIQKFRVIHTNGVHAVHVQFCNCKQGYSLLDQLIEVGWWPATSDRPEAAATEEVLRLFDYVNGSGKISTYHWCQALAALTIPSGSVNPNVSVDMIIKNDM
jgi:hypothetical protein